MIADSDENDNMKRAKEAIEKYFFQLTQGCGRYNCTNTNCASNPNFVKMSNDRAAALAIRLAKEKAELCDSSSKPAKQFKSSPSASQPQTSALSVPQTTAIVATASSLTSSAATMQGIKEPSVSGADKSKSTPNDEEDDDDDDESDVIMNEAPVAFKTQTSSSSLKSLNDALKDAFKFVSNIHENPDNLTNKKIRYLSESKIQKLIAKCKSAQASAPSTSTQATEKSSVYKPLINLAQNVFGSYKSLAISFNSKRDESSETASSSTRETRMPCVAPFNIDFDSLRRSVLLLFSLDDEKSSEEMEKTLDSAIYALCVSIRMTIKKKETDETEINKILNSLMIVNELPILDDPKYMDRCAKIFYATISELPVPHSAKIVRMLAGWHYDELCAILNKLQQYITVCVISKTLDEDNNRNNDDDDENSDSNERYCLHKSEGISGAVGFLRLLYYASILGGRLDPAEQIKKEREIEKDDINFYEEVMAREGANMSMTMFSDIPLFNLRFERLEDALDIRPIDCREPKVPFNLFINECANKYVDIQHDYVEFIQYVQQLEQLYSEHKNDPNLRHLAPKKNIFAFLLNPFFLDITKKNLGLYYDNKIKMIRERRNDMYLSILEGFNIINEPYFKIRLQRNNILTEALTLIELQEQENSSQLRKQLMVEFENEQGIDQGGVSKEFFHLAIDELFNKGYTFFIYDEKTKYYWFNPCSLESEKEFRLIGILFGIAIYNNVILDVQFPNVFFRKLMGKMGTFDDLAQSHPQLHQSLKSILEFEGTEEEFEETFMLTFQISLTDTFESISNFNLKENGDKIPVTLETRKEFVELYADFMLNKGIENSFRAFKRGFMKITINSPLTRWYLPEELEILICGSKVLDWKSLATSTIYDSGFDKNHHYIKEFWEVFDDFTDEQKMLFLKFTTGTDRCPHGGLAELKLTIARNGPDTEKLPTAHTCFNVLLLPEYSNKQKLKEKILKAIEYSRGFGLS